LSSFEDIPLATNTCFAGEVGLNGEIRAVNRIGQRIAEAEKLGFSKILISKYNQKGLKNLSPQIEIKWMGKLEEVYKYLF
jgi:DNA repair protein RadA/Sms